MISFRSWHRQTKFRALNPWCNPALNIQKRDRPAKRLRTKELPAPVEPSHARPSDLENGEAFHMLIGIRHFLMAET